MPADQRCFRGTSSWQNHFPHLLFNNFSATPLFLPKNIERFWWLYTYSVFRWLHTELLFFTLVFKKALVESLRNLFLVFYIFVNNRDCIFLITFLNLFCPESENFCSISQTFAEKSPPELQSLHNEVHSSANRHYSFLPCKVKLPKAGSTQQP